MGTFLCARTKLTDRHYAKSEIKEFLYMSLSQTDTKKIISLPTLVSSFVGIMMAVPLAFALNAPMNASATQQANQVTSQANVDDFAKFAFAFTQGYEAKATSATTSDGGGQGSCSEASVSASGGSGGGGHAASTVQMNSYVAPAGGKGGGGSQRHAPAKMTKHMAAMMNSYNNYTSMVNNSSTVNNVNSNNHVGSHNSTKTSIEVEDSKGVMVGVSNDSTSVQKNANESFNEDSYNTKNETSIINDSFNKDIANTTTNTTTTDIDINHEMNVTKTEDSYNTDSSNSNNETEIEVEAHLDLNSHNETTEVVPVILPVAEEDEVLVTA